MMQKRAIIFCAFGFILIGLLGCDAGEEPTADLPAPTATETKVVLTEPTDSPLATPSLTALPNAVETPTSTPTQPLAPTHTISRLETVVREVVDNLNNKVPIEAFPIMDDFFYGDYGGEIITLSTSQLGRGTHNWLSSRYAGDTYGIRRLAITADAEAPLPNGLTFEEAAALNPLDDSPTAIVYSSGWGVDQEGEALLYFNDEDGLYRWIGAIFSFDQFEALAEYETVSASSEVTTLLKAESSQVALDEEIAPFLNDGETISINPSNTIGLVTGPYNGEVPEAARYALLDLDRLTRVDQRIEFPLELMASRSVWLSDTVLLISYRDQQFEDGPYFGPLARLDIENEELTRLDSNHPLLQPPLRIGPGRAAYVTEMGIFVYDEGAREIETVWEHTEIRLDSPALSPVGPFLIAHTVTQNDALSRETAHYQLVDLETNRMTEVARADAPPMGGWHPPAIWRPAGRFAVITPWTQFAEQDGLTLVDIERPDEPFFLGIGTSNPRWLPESGHLLFEAKIDQELQLHRLNPTTGERVRLVLPEILSLPDPETIHDPDPYFNQTFRIEMPIPDGWTLDRKATDQLIVLEQPPYRLKIALRDLENGSYGDEPFGLLVGELVTPYDYPAASILGSAALQRDLMVDGQRKGVLFTSGESQTELLTDRLGMLIQLEAEAEISDEIVSEVTQMLWSMWIRERYTAKKQSLESANDEALWSANLFFSPNGQWEVTSRSYRPTIIEALVDEDGNGPEEHRQTMTIANADGSISWQVIDLIEGWGLGVGLYEPLRWTTNTLYFTYVPVPGGGCTGGVSGYDLWSFDLVSGAVERLANGRSIYLDYDPNFDRLAYPASQVDVGLVVEEVSTKKKEIYSLPLSQFNWTGLAFSPDGKRVAIVHEKEKCGFIGQEIHVVSLDKMTIEKVFDSSARIFFDLRWVESHRLQLELGDTFETKEWVEIEITS